MNHIGGVALSGLEIIDNQRGVSFNVGLRFIVSIKTLDSFLQSLV